VPERTWSRCGNRRGIQGNVYWCIKSADFLQGLFQEWHNGIVATFIIFRQDKARLRQCPSEGSRLIVDGFTGYFSFHKCAVYRLCDLGDDSQQIPVVSRKASLSARFFTTIEYHSLGPLCVVDISRSWRELVSTIYESIVWKLHPKLNQHNIWFFRHGNHVPFDCGRVNGLLTNCHCWRTCK
jgi:hypothetical protein